MNTVNMHVLLTPGIGFRTFKFCLYLLPMSAILKYHMIGYHVYADDTQLIYLIQI